MIIYTVGHSNLSIAGLLAILRQHSISLLADVRSVPYSRLWPQFNQRELQNSLRDGGIGYFFLGKELGGRPEDDHLHSASGSPNYDAMARTPL